MHVKAAADQFELDDSAFPTAGDDHCLLEAATARRVAAAPERQDAYGSG